MKRLVCLRRKFDRDDRLFNEHKKFMEELMEEGYARKCDGKGRWQNLAFLTGVPKIEKPQQTKICYLGLI